MLGRTDDRATQALADHAGCLPIAEVRGELLRLIKAHNTTILVGETGSGKSTQLPQFILQSGMARVGHQAPCLVAAFVHGWLSCAALWMQACVEGGMHAGRMHCSDAAPASRSHLCSMPRGSGDACHTRYPGGDQVPVYQRQAFFTLMMHGQTCAQRRPCELSAQVGYSVRFDDTSCARTRIRYLTDGMLVREALVDSDLKRYKACPAHTQRALSWQRTLSSMLHAVRPHTPMPMTAASMHATFAGDHLG